MTTPTASRIHVVPTGDIIDHEVSEECICGPDSEACEGGWVVIHHSLDGRERTEPEQALYTE